jgi:hypothetical protein
MREIAYRLLGFSILQSLNASVLTVSPTAEEKIENFTLRNVRGIDGVVVEKFQALGNQKLEYDEVIESIVELRDFSEQAYVVFDSTITISGVKFDSSIPVAIGALSLNQINERRKNIKEIKNKSQSKEGTNAISVPVTKIHEMKLE